MSGRGSVGAGCALLAVLGAGCAEEASRVGAPSREPIVRRSHEAREPVRIVYDRPAMPERGATTRPGEEPPVWQEKRGPMPPALKGRGEAEVSFFGVRADAHHIVYLIDRSGSMAPTFDEVRFELLKSISRLKPSQNFAVVLFGKDAPIVGPAPTLSPADVKHKVAAARFLKDIVAAGATTALLALERAFALLAKADHARPGTNVFLLSDSDLGGAAHGAPYFAKDGR
ncbi:MAG: VWA domain-containing protein, partial [Planctomycetota bacterium]